MAQYYDPYQQANIFKLYANIENQKSEEEKEEKEKFTKRATAGISVGKSAYKILEANRLEDKTDAQNLITESRSEFHKGGFMKKHKDLDKPKSIRSWLKQRYSTSPEERIETAELNKKGILRKQEILDERDEIFSKVEEGRLKVKDTLASELTRAEEFVDPEGQEIYDNVYNETKDRLTKERTMAQAKIKNNAFDTGTNPMQRLKEKDRIGGTRIPDDFSSNFNLESQTRKNIDYTVNSIRSNATTNAVPFPKSNTNEIISSTGGDKNWVPKGGPFKGVEVPTKGIETEIIGGAIDEVGETAGEVVGEASGGIGPVSAALEAKNLYDVYSEYGASGEDKVKATAESAADLASSYAISSGNPYAMAAGGIYKTGKFAYDLLA